MDRGCVCHLDFLISLSARLSVSHADISAGLWQFGADVPWECPLIGVVRKWLVDRQNDAIGPKRIRFEKSVVDRQRETGSLLKHVNREYL